MGYNDTLNKQQLRLHLTIMPEHSQDFPDIATFHKYIQKLVDNRATLGRVEATVPIRQYSINTILPAMTTKSNTSQKLKKTADALAEFLRSTDPLN